MCLDMQLVWPTPYAPHRLDAAQSRRAIICDHKTVLQDLALPLRLLMGCTLFVVKALRSVRVPGRLINIMFMDMLVLQGAHEVPASR